jgi:hypothetical protein
MPNYTLADGETVKNKLGARSHHEDFESALLDVIELMANTTHTRETNPSRCQTAR